MFIYSTQTTEVVNAIKKHVRSNTALISIAEHTDIDVEGLIQELNKEGIAFMGGIFPKVIHGNKIFEKGIVANTLHNIEKLFVIRGISYKNYRIPPIDFKDRDYSLFTYVDGLTSNISHFLNRLYLNYGMETTYFGGGAGSLSLEQKPCVFNNEGLFEDAAVVGVMRMTSRIGVKHGWKKVDGPFIVTKADGNIIKEINWKNPFEVYRSVVEKHSKRKFNEHNFFDLAKGYPFGLVKKEGECIVRDPLMVNESGELICVGEVENNAVVDILNGNKESLINAAKSAAAECIYQSENPRKAIIIDCISRILFLEKHFDEELNAITKLIKDQYPDVSIGGALTIGEISSYGEGFLELYNKTTVVGMFEL
ncbi:MAG: FIST C-terminal domain-containing protein [Winogradskyella sp.]|uniref:FIST signal transduction protein n=1 Tax=Winogradskyella sp. TaxID=1883156 RepID=UPI0025E6D6C4|nr:FIST N-terminal domain-containing protein [Winogradskyella sp.]NRB60285.1 FIST C-terminal domain-containing protein [Winogradskyella sp.]